MVRAMLVVASAALLLANTGLARAQARAASASPPTRGALYADGQTGRYLLGGSWLYRADRGDVGLARGWFRAGAATAGWTPAAVPNAYNAGDFSNSSMTGYVGWYRRDFTLPRNAFPRYVPAGARRWIIRFESVNYRATVWLNGRRLGSHEGAFVPFELDLTALRGGINHLVVRVDNRRTGAAMPPGPGGGWWNYGGLLREVYLRAVARADISTVAIRTAQRCPRCTATVTVQVRVRNVTFGPQYVALSGSYGSSRLTFGGATIGPRGSWTAVARTPVSHPRLWSIGHPALYRASLTLRDGSGRRVGGYVTESGIRTIRVTAGGRLTLNGRILNLRGVALHEQDLHVGGALDPAHLRSIVGWARTLGSTVLRAHYPLNPQIEEMADRDGLLIWSEIPIYQVSDTYLRQPGWRARANALLSQNIVANQNHPSVMLWSVANELPTPATDGEARYIAGAAALARRLDPTRPVGMAVGDWPGVPCQQAYRPLDAVGFNDYFGWFDAGGGATDDRDQLGPFLDSFRACYPRKAVLVTEFGFDANRSGPVEERGTYEFQANSAAYHLRVFGSKPWLSGAMYFTIQSYVAFPGYTGGNPRVNSPFNEKGLVDFGGSFKPAFSVVSSIYHATRQIR
jgi:beta-glucuronidase